VAPGIRRVGAANTTAYLNKFLSAIVILSQVHYYPTSQVNKFEVLAPCATCDVAVHAVHQRLAATHV
jgi:hypothetical protein